MFLRLLALPVLFSVFATLHVASAQDSQSPTEAAKAKRKKTVLKKNGNPELYPDSYDLDFVWYAYHFMQSSKPGSHIAALSRLTNKKLNDKCPMSIEKLLDRIEAQLSDT